MSHDALRELLGIDTEDFEWQDISLCRGVATNQFYDDYENDEQVARVIDDMCLSCPVMKQCYQRGIQTNEWGVWGGVFLVAGRPDENKNRHKSPEVKKEMVERLFSE
jgi:hypothetical protein